MNRSIAVLALCLIATVALAHYPGKITIDAAAKKQLPVPFDHAKHGDTLVRSCDTCHHTNKGLTKAQTDKVEVPKCSECHLDPKDAKVPTMREMSPTKNPFHIRCIACHKEQKKGPTLCTQCHRK
jgi:Class III cytochrome C family